MALQTGIGLSKIVFLVSAGYTGTILLKNSKLSDIIGELQKLVKGLENSVDSENADVDPIAAQVRWLAQEVRQLASTRQITVLNGNSSQTDVSSLILPAATVGALGYGYMRWKGVSFSDLMYVTKHNMAAAVTSLTENLQGVTETLEKARKHLLQRVQNLDEKIDDQRKLSDSIMNEVHNARKDFVQVNDELHRLTETVGTLKGKMDEFDQTQTLTLEGVDILVQFAKGSSTSVSALTQFTKEVSARKSRYQLPSSENLGLQALMFITDGKLETDDQIKKLMRSSSMRIAEV